MNGAHHHVLAIEISNPSAIAPPGSDDSAGVALASIRESAVEVIGVEPVRAGSRGGSDDDLLPAIDRLFGRAGLTARSCGLSRVAVSIGPGGYTSVRVACAAAKMIAEGTGARCVGVPTAQVVIEALGDAAKSRRVCVFLASKGETAWAQTFASGTPDDQGEIITPDRVAAMLTRGVTLVVGDRFVPEAMRREIDRLGVEMREPVFSAAACARLGARLPAIDAAELIPLYPREPDAVTLWRARTSG